MTTEPSVPDILWRDPAFQQLSQRGQRELLGRPMTNMDALADGCVDEHLPSLPTCEMQPADYTAAYTYSCGVCGASFPDNGEAWIGHVRECVPASAAVHAFTNLDGSRVTMTAKRSGPPGMRLTPVVTIRIESPDGDFSEMTVPAVAASAFARVLDSAARYPRPKATPGYGPIR